MNPSDFLGARRLAVSLLHKDMPELFETAAINPTLVSEWLADLLVARRSLEREADLLMEAIDDVRAALRHAGQDGNKIVQFRSAVDSAA